MKTESKCRSLQFYLLLGLLGPVGLVVSINTVSLYSQALNAIDTAYDRRLLASAKSIGEQLDVTGYDAASSLRVIVSYAALAKLAQLLQQPHVKLLDLATVMRAVALDLSALTADKNIDFRLEPVAAPIAAHEWILSCRSAFFNRFRLAIGQAARV